MGVLHTSAPVSINGQSRGVLPTSSSGVGSKSAGLSRRAGGPPGRSSVSPEAAHEREPLLASSTARRASDDGSGGDDDDKKAARRGEVAENDAATSSAILVGSYALSAADAADAEELQDAAAVVAAVEGSSGDAGSRSPTSPGAPAAASCMVSPSVLALRRGPGRPLATEHRRRTLRNRWWLYVTLTRLPLLSRARKQPLSVAVVPDATTSIKSP